MYKHSHKKNICIKYPAFWAAVIVFMILILFNTYIPVMRSLPDEIGAIAFAAKLVGYDWNYVLTHPEMYYGSWYYLLYISVILYSKRSINTLSMFAGSRCFFACFNSIYSW